MSAYLACYALSLACGFVLGFAIFELGARLDGWRWSKLLRKDESIQKRKHLGFVPPVGEALQCPPQQDADAGAYHVGHGEQDQVFKVHRPIFGAAAKPASLSCNPEREEAKV